MTDFYQQRYRAYHEATFGVDPASLLEPLVKHLAPGARILDAGCGSGRDLCWLKARGFPVTGFERSQGLAQLARGNAGCKVIEGDFASYDFSKLRFDAVLLCGSLVHTPQLLLAGVLANILRCLTPRGRVLISLKKGKGSAVKPDGRTFYYWQDRELRRMFSNFGFQVLEFQQGASKVNSRDIWLSYVLG